MGYWGTTLTGLSLQLFGDLNPDGGEMLWGDAPADDLGDGLDKLITRLKTDLGRWPTVDEVDAVKATAPEMIEAIAAATATFTNDIGRPPTDGEIAAGLAFADTGISLDCAMRSDITVGDTVSWPIMRDAGFFREIDHIVEGTVVAIEDRKAKSNWGGEHCTQKFVVVRREDSVDDIDIRYVHKTLPGDPSLAERNARYLSRDDG